MVETNYRFKGMTLPKCKQRSIQRYIDDGVDPGHFLSSCLANDLQKAFGNADNWSLELIPVIVAYIYNRVPMTCVGSWDTVHNWKGYNNMEEETKELEASNV